MTVLHRGTVIAIWVICAVLLVVVVCLAFYLLCYRRRRQQQRRIRRRFIELDEENVLQSTTYNRSSDGMDLYSGFQRRMLEELEALPSPLQSPNFPTPVVVYLRVRRDQPCTEPCDILLTVERLRDCLPTDRNNLELLGNDRDYHGDFLLYTSPLEFRDAGTYVVRAFVVYPTRKEVGAVHQFTYVVTPRSNSVPLYNYSSTGGRQDTSIDIDIARRLAERSGGARTGGPFSGGDGTGVPSCHHPGALTVVPDAAVAAASPYALQATHRLPVAPVITPASGEVTTSTDIIVSPHELSTTPDQLRYSVDGSYPTLLYTGPFTLSLPPPALLPSQHRHVVVKAIAVRISNSGLQSPPAPAFGNVSDITRAVLKVRPAGFSYYDPQVPTPSARIRATDATLYFDESQNPPNTETVYELVYVHEARRKVRYSRQCTQLYAGQPIPLPENVATVHAWTVMRDGGTAQDTAASPEAEKVRSVPTIYDCSRAATERGKLSRRRVEQYNIRPEQLLPPPVLCVSCGDMELVFDDPPAHGRIAYTLNDTEPALCDVYPPACAVLVLDPASETYARDAERKRVNTRIRKSSSELLSPILGDRDGAHTVLSQPGRPVRVTQLETDAVYVTARTFVPIYEGSHGELSGGGGAQGGSGAGGGKLLGYRFSDVFHRGFYFAN